MTTAAVNDTLTITLRPSAERGHFDHGWLDARHTFSFGAYHDPAYMGFGALRVINEDIVAPGRGFPPHPHREMEIITYILSGELEHTDSLGNRGIIRPGEIQRISAGSGIRHSETNASRETPVHLLQIWIVPSKSGGAPSYDQRSIRAVPGRLRPIVTRDGRDGTIDIRQDAAILAGSFPEGGKATHAVLTGRRAWVQMARAGGALNGVRLEPGDGAGITGTGEIALELDAGAEVLLFDVP
ncbi:MAG: pirin family protein [Phycisphaerales bacterium]